MERRKADVIVIGAGTAGIRAFREARRCGVRAVLAQGGPFGTTCARVGCMPSKLLIQAAHAAHAVKEAKRFGIEAHLERVDGRKVMERVRSLRDDFVRPILEEMDAIPAPSRLEGYASFEDAGTIRVGDKLVDFAAAVIATGSSPFIPGVFEKLQPSVLSTTDTFFELETLPESTAVIGAGNIGLEMGQALHRLGVRVKLFEARDALTLLRDEDTARLLERVFGEELDLCLGCEIRGAEPRDGGVEIEWSQDGGASRFDHFDMVLCATGRKPNLEKLNLSRANVALNESGGPELNQRSMRCKPMDASQKPRVYLAGDVAGTRPVLHEAADEGRIAGLNASSRDGDRSYLRKTPMTVVFTDPQVATVGLARDADDIVVARSSYTRQGRARVMGRNVGEACLYARECDARIVGADLFMPGAEHVAHLVAAWIEAGLTVEEVLDLPFYHPVLEEGLRGALKRLGARLGLTRAPDERDLDCGPGT